MKEFDRNKYHIAAFDLDGTVLNHGIMSDRVREALKDLSNSGIIVAVATGRNTGWLEDEIGNCFMYKVLSNGANVKDSENNMIFSHELDRKTSVEIGRHILEIGGVTCFFRNNDVLMDIAYKKAFIGDFYPNLPENFDYCKVVLPGCVENVVDNLLKEAEESSEPLYKIHCKLRSHESCREFIEWLSRFDNIEVVDMNDFSVEITDKGITKASGLRELAEYCGYTAENIIVFGDGMNDIDMMNKCGYAVAMENGDKEAKDAADYVALPVDQDGVAVLIDWFLGKR